MPVTYLMDQHRRAVLADVKGRLTLAEVFETAKRIRREPFFHPSFSLLIDLSDAEGMALDAGGMSDFIHGNQDPFQPGVRRAIVATRPDTYGMARMYQSVSGDLNVCIFRSRDEALSWLGLVPVNNG